MNGLVTIVLKGPELERAMKLANSICHVNSVVFPQVYLTNNYRRKFLVKSCKCCSLIEGFLRCYDLKRQQVSSFICSTHLPTGALPMLLLGARRQVTGYHIEIIVCMCKPSLALGLPQQVSPYRVRVYGLL